MNNRGSRSRATSRFFFSQKSSHASGREKFSDLQVAAINAFKVHHQSPQSPGHVTRERDLTERTRPAVASVPKKGHGTYRQPETNESCTLPDLSYTATNIPADQSLLPSVRAESGSNPAAQLSDWKKDVLRLLSGLARHGRPIDGV
jgi:hypothetical protein